MLSDEEIVRIATENVEGVMNNCSKVLNEVYEEMRDEAINMYDAFIQQFYTYPTKAYILHGTSKPGTKTGFNLYRGIGAKDQFIKKRGVKKPSLTISFSASDMEDDYQYNSAQEVLGQTMGGVRGVPPYWWMTWTGSYYGRHFSYSGYMQGAFDTFENRFDDIVEAIFFPKWEKLGY